MRILVTGGSGFLGARLIPNLVAAGHDVVALARSEGSAEKIRRLGARPVAGDLDKPRALSLPPVDAVVHAAAHFRFSGPRAPFFRVNVKGTDVLLKAAEKAGAKTFIYVSAGAVIMDDRGSPIRDADESAHTYPKSFSSYIASKARGEALVLAANKPGFRTIALRPPAIWGPGDAVSREIPRALASGQFAFINQGDYPVSTCHVDNLIEAIGCALVRGEGGRAYFINDAEPIRFRSFVDALARQQGLSTQGVRSVPYGVAFLLGRLMEIGAALTFAKDDPVLSRTMVRLIGREFTTSDAAARRALGYVGKISRSAGMAMYEA